MINLTVKRALENTAIKVDNVEVLIPLTYIYVGLTNVSGSPSMSDYVIFPQMHPIFTTSTSDLVGGKMSTS